MKTKYILILAALLMASPVWAQPVPKPKAAPVAKKAVPKKVAPKAAPVAKKVVPEPVVTPEVKVEGRVTVVEPKVEEKKAEESAMDPVETKVEDKGYGGVVANHAIKLGFTLLSLLLSGLVFVLLKKFGFQAQNEKVQDVLVKAAGFAEQWSLKTAKVEGTTKPGGPEKLDKALTFALDMATEYRLPVKGKDWWEGQLESWLGVKNGS